MAFVTKIKEPRTPSVTLLYRRHLRDSFPLLFSPLLRVPYYVTGLLDHSLSRKKRKMYLPSTSPDTARPAQTDPDPRPRLPANAACNSTCTGRPAQTRHETPARHSRPAPGYPKGNSGRRTLQQRQEGNLYSSRLYIRYTRSGETRTAKRGRSPAARRPTKREHIRRKVCSRVNR